MVLRRLPRQLRASALGLPLVLTVGCSTSSPPKRPEGPRSTLHRDELGRCFLHVDNSCPEGVRCNPPPPEEVDCPADASQLATDRWRSKLGRIEDGTCVQTAPPVCVPQTSRCEERPGTAVPCPEDTKKLEFDRYVPKPPKKRLWRDPQGVCWEAEDVRCPPPEVATCNPPPPRKVDCPADPTALDSDAYTPAPKLAGRILRRADGSCILLAEPPKCPPTATCNPPPPRPIACPEDPKEIHTDLLKPPTPRP